MPKAYLIENGVVIASGTFSEVPEGWSTTPPANKVNTPQIVEKKKDDTLVSPVTFKMSFTAQERIQIRALRDSTDPDNAQAKLFLDDWFDIVDDPRLSYVNLALPSIRQGLEFLVTLNILTQDRVEEILSGKVQ